MKTKELIEAINHIAADPEEAASIARFVGFYLQDHRPEDEKLFYKNLLERLTKGEPVHYILNTAYFGNLTLFVAEGVLIPRPETEELCDRVMKENHEGVEMSLLDVGTGSACIPCLLCYNNKLWRADAVDISEKALNIAAKNIAQFNLQNRITLLQKDVLSQQEWKTDYDVIVSNPPYIAENEAEAMEKGVLDWEPHIALFAEEDPLKFYKQLKVIMERQAKSNVKLYAEINPLYCRETVELFEPEFRVEVMKDITEKERFIRVSH